MLYVTAVPSRTTLNYILRYTFRSMPVEVDISQRYRTATTICWSGGRQPGKNYHALRSTAPGNRYHYRRRRHACRHSPAAAVATAAPAWHPDPAGRQAG